jgi:hypothetical protein
LTEAEVDAYAANNGYLTSFTEVDGDATNEIQDLDLTGNDLTITNNGSATTIDLSTYLDNTDTQLTEVEVDAYVSNNGYLTAFTEVDGDITNEIQDLNLTGNDLTITNNVTATTVDLSGYLDNTDNQNLANVLSQGNDAGAVNIVNILDPVNPQDAATKAYVDALEALVIDLDNRLTIIEECACDSTAGFNGPGNDQLEEAILYQNIPNPFNNTSLIKYYIPSYANSANIVISNDMGKIVSNIDLHEVGSYGETHINAEGLAPATYYYSLYINQVLVDTKKMVVQ